MAYTPQTIHKGDRSGGVSVQDPSALATALENMDTALAAAGDVSQTSVAITDSSGGTASQTITDEACYQTITIPITNANIADGDILTTYTPGFAFSIVGFYYVVDTPVTTAAKASTINLEVGTTNLTGGVISLTSAGMATLGTVISGTAITGNNSGSSTDTISIEASSTTAFVEGNGCFIIKIRNNTLRNAISSAVDEVNKLVADVAAIIATVA